MFALLSYQSKGYDWQWLSFPFIDGGVQVTRTSDTHQLLLRKVYFFHSAEVSVYTTMDNKLVLHLSRFQACSGPNQTQIQLNQLPPQKVTFSCENNNQLSFSTVTTHLNKMIVNFEESELTINFADWNISDIKKDQFKQLHPHYFERLGQPSKYQWSRD
ncbi:hypothetical protein VEZ01S_38_00010 [Vibrio ezurae NBRC 102218]|uniref:Uncharacterized protein n=1 Tax=Vibrio ezurae NBRC 102218 TaxID=1219080 RepID=U3B5A0_9VIBR|nr:hypothetical protein VEZ01S_38_00010 [Vibrio ezurae NBRC 102218]